MLRKRSGDRCEHCGKPLLGRAERHHRQRKQIGGDRLANLIIVLPECHVPVIHAQPERSRAMGWIVSSYEPDPAMVPIWINGRRWLLDDRGLMKLVP